MHLDWIVHQRELLQMRVHFWQWYLSLLKSCLYQFSTDDKQHWVIWNNKWLVLNSLSSAGWLTRCKSNTIQSITIHAVLNISECSLNQMNRLCWRWKSLFVQRFVTHALHVGLLSSKYWWGSFGLWERRSKEVQQFQK